MIVVTAPAASKAHGGGTVQMSWSASDADGDVLSYVVYYSTDAGVSRRLLEPYLTQPRLVWPRSALASADRARIRVIATDGVLSASAESAVFSVTKHPPRVRILNPRQGRTYGGYATVILEAEAYDNEDGRLDGSKISWSTSNKRLGSGSTTTISTGDLAEGANVLTATATDSSSASGSASVTITVRRSNEAPAAVDDIVHTATGEGVTADVVSNDRDRDHNIDPYTLTVVLPLTQGVARTADSARYGRAIQYTPTGAGYDALIYSVCDLFGECTTAELTVAVRSSD